MKRSVNSLARTFCLLCLCVVATSCSPDVSDKHLVMVSVADGQTLVHGQKQLLGLAGTKAGTWVDARSAEDYRAGHIPGAVSLPYERVNTDHKMLKSYDVLIVYGNDYDDPRANGMSKRLLQLGYDDVRTLTGGMRAWKAEGNSVEQ